MFIKVAPALALVLLATLQVVFANNSPIVLDIGKHSDASKVMVRSYWKEMEDDSALGSLHESHLAAVKDDNNTSHDLTLPYFPMIINLGGVSICLIDISIEGLDLVELPSILDLRPVQGVITIPIQVPSLSFNAGSYVAGGKVKNLPFVGTGSSSAHIGLSNLNIALSYETQGLLNFCPVANSTNFIMTLDQLSINFEDLNPGQDSGDLINAMLNSVTDDITKWINLLLNEPAGKNLLERLIIAVLSSQLPNSNCESGYTSGDEEAADLERFLVGQGNSLAEFTQVLETIISKLSGRMEILEETRAFFELVEDLLPEMDLGHASLIQ